MKKAPINHPTDVQPIEPNCVRKCSFYAIPFANEYSTYAFVLGNRDFESTTQPSI